MLGNGQLDGAFGLGGVSVIRSAPAFPLAVRSIGGRIVVVSQDGGGVYVSKLWE